MSHRTASQPEFFAGSGASQNDPNALFGGLDPATSAVSQHLFSAGSSMVQERLQRGWMSLDSLRFYFSVNNSYVKNKLRLVFFPFVHKNWTRLMVSQGDEDAYRAPRDDINAPDLYIPTMAFLTWVMLSAIVLGAQLKFTPEAFGACASKVGQMLCGGFLPFFFFFFLLTFVQRVLLCCCWRWER